MQIEKPMEEKVLWRPMLREALAILAAAPEEQIAANGPGCIACDLSGEFDHGRSVALAHASLTEPQRASLDRIDTALEAMEPSDLECWNTSVLGRPAWQLVRNLAEQALHEFGWDRAKPTKSVEVEPGIRQREFNEDR
jgi:hypothetical protein